MGESEPRGSNSSSTLTNLFVKLKRDVAVATNLPADLPKREDGVPSSSDKQKSTSGDQLKALQEISESLETVISSPLYGDFVSVLVPAFLDYLQCSNAQFIAELREQQARKQMLEILYRLPVNDTLKMHSRSILGTMFQLLEMDNEENVLLCLRIIIEHHKSYRPQHCSEINAFLDFVRKIYSELSQNVAAIFAGPQVGSDGEFSIESPGMVSQMTITTTNSDGQQLRQTIIPKAQTSLKVLAELPLITVLFYQLYKNQVHKTIGDFFHIVTDTLTHQPPKRNTSENQSAFSDELYVDFMTAQVKTLSFVAYGLKVYPEIIRQHAQPIAEGIMGLLKTCPAEVTHLRKEIMVATKHIFSSELRNNFIPHINELFDDRVLIGSAFTVRESLRALCYNTLADLINHIKISLSFSQSATAIYYFSRCLLDDTLPVSLQAASAKLLLNLGSDLISAKAVTGSNPSSQFESPNVAHSKQIQLKLMQVFVKKFKVLAEYHLPLIFKKCEEQSKSLDDKSLKSSECTQVLSEMTSDSCEQESSGDSSKPLDMEVESEAASVVDKDSSNVDSDKKTDTGCVHVSIPEGVIAPMSASECRNLVRVYIMATKSVAQNLTFSLPSSANEPSKSNSAAVLEPAIVEVLNDLLFYALKALDIYLVSYTSQGTPFVRSSNVSSSNSNAPRMKEEKEILEWFAQIYTYQPVHIFREVFSHSIPFIVQRLRENYALQIIVNSFLATSSTSPAFATILVEYLLERMPELGGSSEGPESLKQVSKAEKRKSDATSSSDVSTLYLKLFKLVFGSVSLLAHANEQMLKPHLHALVNQSMKLSQTARDPINYFYLLRALFRSIGGGSHDLLYQEFLPLLCNLLQGLNLLQSGHHKSQVKDLFVELSLTVPVRLSSLLPYLPLLMGPLVSALNGSSALINQGLRTLELFVDNLQPDFLYDHIQPVRADLMQALWRTVRNSNPLLATTAFRVLGKFGGTNRKMLKEPQMLTFDPLASGKNRKGVSIAFRFKDSTATSLLPIDDFVEAAADCIASQTSDDEFYLQQSFQIIKTVLEFYLKAALPDSETFEYFEKVLEQSELSVRYSVCNSENVQNPAEMSIRRTIRKLLVGMFSSCYVKCLEKQALKFTKDLLRSFAVLSIFRDRVSNEESLKEIKKRRENACDPFDGRTIAEAVCETFKSEDQEAMQSYLFIIEHLFSSCSDIIGGPKTNELSLFQSLIEGICDCFYEKAWYKKQAGCVMLDKFMDLMDVKFLLLNQSKIVHSLQFAFIDLAGEVSNGVLESLGSSLKCLIRQCCSSEKMHDDAKLKQLQLVSNDKVVDDVIREIASPNTALRNQMCECIKLMAECSEVSVCNLLTANGASNSSSISGSNEHMSYVNEIVPPVKHRLRFLPVNTQIGLMSANAFLLSQMGTPSLLAYDTANQSHVEYLEELFFICETEDEALKKALASSKSPVNSSVVFSLREAALKNLSECHFIADESLHERIFTVLYDALNSSNDDIQKVGDKCMEVFLANCGKDKRQKAHVYMRELLKSLMNNYKVLNLNAVARLSSLSVLFPQSFNERFCRSIVMEHLTCWVRDMTELKRSSSEADYSLELKTCAQIINMFHLLPTAPVSLVEPLIELVINTEVTLGRHFANPMRPPLLKFLSQHCETACKFFMTHESLKSGKKLSLFLFNLKHEFGKPLLDYLKSNSHLLTRAGLKCAADQDEITEVVQTSDLSVQNGLVRIIHAIVQIDSVWIASQPAIVKSLRAIWDSSEFKSRHHNLNFVPDVLWLEVDLILDCLIAAFRYDTTAYPDTKLLFSLTTVISSSYLTGSLTLKTFLAEGLLNLETELLRKIFLDFSEIFEDPSCDFECKSKFISLVIIPSFRNAMKEDKVDELLGEKPNPESENPANLLNVFLNKFLISELNQPDCMRIVILQLACLFVEFCASHIHDAVSKRQQGQKMRKLMGFAWPCLLNKACIDPSTKYHGHLLLTHIIAKFPINKKIVLQVFYSLLKAHGQETRSVIRESLDLLTPSLSLRMDDGDAMLAHWTKKIMIEEGHALPQMLHIIWLIVKHQKIFFRVRHSVTTMMLNAMNRLVFSSSVSLDNRRQAIDLAEVFILWQQDSRSENNKQPIKAQEPSSEVMTSQDDCASSQSEDDSDCQKVAETVVNFLMRIAASVHDSSNTNNSQCEAYVKRCLSLLELAFSQSVWGGALRVDVRLFWMEKVLLTTDQPNTNIPNLLSCVELFDLCLKTLSTEALVTNLRAIQRGLSSFLHCKTSRVYKSYFDFLSKLLKSVPPLKSALNGSNVAKQLDPNFDDSMDIDDQSECGSPEKSNRNATSLDAFYDIVYKCIFDGLQTYEKSAQMANYKMVQPIVYLLNSVYLNSSFPLDHDLTERILKCLQRLTREHLSPSQAAQCDHAISELITTLVRVLQPRLAHLNPDLRKLFIQVLLVSLIEKSTDSKLIQSLLECLDTWVRGVRPQEQFVLGSTTGLTMREKSLLLFKMMNSLEKRFSEDATLQKTFLKTVLYVYREPELNKTELASKLEPAFMAGLRFSGDPELRMEFFQLWSANIGTASLFTQMLYLVCSHNWESMQDHFWIKQCIQLVLTADKEPEHYSFDPDVIKRNKENVNSLPKMESMVLDEVTDTQKTKATWMSEWREQFLNTPQNQNCHQSLEKFIQLLGSLVNKSVELAHKVWVMLLPEVWKSLTVENRKTLAAEINPFLISGAHLIQRDSPHSAIKTFLEAVSNCQPPIVLRPIVLKYVGKSHNSWHRSLLNLEKIYEKQHPSAVRDFLQSDTSSSEAGREQTSLNAAFNEYFDNVDPNVCHPRDTFENLAALCKGLYEEDLWAALWMCHAQYGETKSALSYQVQGQFVEAQQSYESVIGSARSQLDSSVACASALPEYQLWEEEWMGCCRQLNEWEVLQEVSKSEDHPNPHLILECAWRSQDWKKVEDTLNVVEINSAREVAWKYQLLRGYLSVFKPESPQVQQVNSSVTSSDLNPSGGSGNSQQQAMEAAVNNGMALAIKEWNRLPKIVSLAHIPLLQGAHQLVEVSEAHQIQVGINQQQQQSMNRASSLHEMKAVVKTWKNRLATGSDDVSYWSDLFLWRHHSYSAIINAFEHHPNSQQQATPSGIQPPQLSPFGPSPSQQSSAGNEPTNNPYAMQGVHAQAQAIIAFGQIARKQGLYSVCLESLARIHAIASVPIVDCYQKILQQIKCYLSLSEGTDSSELRKGLDVIDQTNLKYFNPEMISDFYALKGLFLNLVGESEEANKAFSAAVQFNDNSIKSWSYWGDYFRTVFLSTKDVEFAKSSILCYLHSCRHQKETKSRLNMAKTLSFLPHDDESNQLAEAIEKCSPGVPTVHWLHWIPQLCNSILRKEGSHMINILLNVAKVYPQSVYFPIRTIYTCLKMKIQQDHNPFEEASSPVKEPMSNEPSSVKAESMEVSEGQHDTAQSSGIPREVIATEAEPSAVSMESDSTNVEVIPKAEPTEPLAQPQGSNSVDSPSRPPSTSSNMSLTRAQSISLSYSYSKYKNPFKFCTKVIYVQRDAHPTLLAALESIADQIQTLPRVWFEPILDKLNQLLKEHLDIAFENPASVSGTVLQPPALASLSSLLSHFNCEEDTASLGSFGFQQDFPLQHKQLDPEFDALKRRILDDFEMSDLESMRLLPFINKLRKWISVFEKKMGSSNENESFLMGKKCRFLINFSAETAEIELPADFQTPKNSSYSLKVSRFLPKVQLVKTNKSIMRRVFLRASNGKVFAYRLLFSEDQKQLPFGHVDERISQLMRLVQSYFVDKRKETSKRLLTLSPPAVTTLAPNLRLLLDDCSSQSLFDIYRESLREAGMDPYSPIKAYLEQVVVRRGDPDHLLKVFNSVQNTTVPKSRLREWALITYPDPTDYFAFRKQFIGHLSLLSVMQFLLNLNPVDLEGLDIVKQSGFIVPTKLTFQALTSKFPADLSLRLTPGIVDFMGPLGVSGPFFQNFLAACFSLVDPQCKFEAFLSAIMQDVIVLDDKNSGNQDGVSNEVLLNSRDSAIQDTIVRLHSIAESIPRGSQNLKVLLANNSHLRNISKTHPAWIPWF